MDVWVERELDGCAFPDQRLKARLGKLLDDLGRRIGGTIPAASLDWAATKAAYRFFDNPRIDDTIPAWALRGHRRPVTYPTNAPPRGLPSPSSSATKDGPSAVRS